MGRRGRCGGDERAGRFFDPDIVAAREFYDRHAVAVGDIGSRMALPAIRAGDEIPCRKRGAYATSLRASAITSSFAFDIFASRSSMRDESLSELLLALRDGDLGRKRCRPTGRLPETDRVYHVKGCGDLVLREPFSRKRDPKVEFLCRLLKGLKGQAALLDRPPTILWAVRNGRP